MPRPIIVATLLAGTLDLLSAFVFAWPAGMAPDGVLRFVASGPLGDGALRGGAGAAAAGLLVHYAIMACMAAAYMVAAERIPALTARPMLAGIAYGIALWFLMYWIVRPLRWTTLPHPTQAVPIAKQLFSHVVLVGLPIAFVAKRYLAPARRNAL